MNKKNTGKQGRKNLTEHYVFNTPKYLIILFTIYVHQEFKNMVKTTPQKLRKKILKHYLIRSTQLDFKKDEFISTVAYVFFVYTFNLELKNMKYKMKSYII